jgi:hypothetical protein
MTTSRSKGGRPKGSTNKKKEATTSSDDSPFKQAYDTQPTKKQRMVFSKLLDDNLKLMSDNQDLTHIIANHEHSIVGFRAVISYLENQLGLRSSQ